MDKLAVIVPSRGLMFSETLEELLNELEGFNYEIFWAHERPLPECFNEPTEEALKDPEVFAVLFVEDDMIIPKGMSNTKRPVKTPMRDKTTEAMTIMGTRTELNWMTRTMLMMKMAV